MKFVFEGNHCNIFDNKCKLVATIEKDKSNLYRITSPAKQAARANRADLSKSLTLWHRRLGHLNQADMIRLSSGVAEGIPQDLDHDMVKICEGCALGKTPRGNFPKASHNSTTYPLQIVHSDICGPFPTKSMKNNYQYFITFLDQHTRYCMAFPLKRKSEAFDALKTYTLLVNNTFRSQGHRITALQSDNGGEYLSRQSKIFLQSMGISHRASVPYQPEQNGMTEGINRTILDSAESMRHQ